MSKVLIEKDVAEAIEQLRERFADRVIFVNKGNLDNRLNRIDDWTLAKALIEGYEPVNEIVMVLSD